MLDMREVIPEVLKKMEKEKETRKEIVKRDGCFPIIRYAKDLKEEEIENALSGYAKGCRREDIIAIFNLENKGKKGVLLSTEGMYSSWLIERKELPFALILYRKIESAHTVPSEPYRLHISDYNGKWYSFDCGNAMFCNYLFGWTISRIKSSWYDRTSEPFRVGDMIEGLECEKDPHLILYVSVPYKTKKTRNNVVDTLLLNLKKRTLETREVEQRDTIRKARAIPHTGQYLGAALFLDFDTKKIVNFAGKPAVYKELKGVPVGTIARLYEVFDDIHFGFCYETEEHGELYFAQNGQFFADRDGQQTEESMRPGEMIFMDGSCFRDRLEALPYMTEHTERKTFRVWTTTGAIHRIRDVEKFPVRGESVSMEEIKCGAPGTIWREVADNGQKTAINRIEIFAETEIEFPKPGEMQHSAADDRNGTTEE